MGSSDHSKLREPTAPIKSPGMEGGCTKSNARTPPLGKDGLRLEMRDDAGVSITVVLLNSELMEVTDVPCNRVEFIGLSAKLSSEDGNGTLPLSGFTRRAFLTSFTWADAFLRRILRRLLIIVGSEPPELREESFDPDPDVALD